MFSLQPPRHIPTLPKCVMPDGGLHGSTTSKPDGVARERRSPVGRLAVRGRTTPLTGPHGRWPWLPRWATTCHHGPFPEAWELE
jgi:hypothetical protein